MQIKERLGEALVFVCMWAAGAGNQNGTEGVTGRKARGLQMEEIGCKCQTFFSPS